MQRRPPNLRSVGSNTVVKVPRLIRTRCFSDTALPYRMGPDM